MNPLQQLRSYLCAAQLQGMIVPSADEFLSEFSPPANRRLAWATGFRGSTGFAVILRNDCALFLDGRYRLQGISDTEGTGIAIVPATIEARREWLKSALPPGSTIQFDPRLHSMAEHAQWRELAAGLGLNLRVSTDNPIDRLWAQRPPTHRPFIVDYPSCYAGEPFENKCASLVDYVNSRGWRGLFIADPEDVSWLLNVRADKESTHTEVGEWHIVPSCPSRALVEKDGTVTWFVDEDRVTWEVRNRIGEHVTLSSMNQLPSVLHSASRQGRIGASLRRTPAAMDAGILGEAICDWVDDESVAHRRWRKHDRELICARRAHIVDSVAVVRFMAWIDQAVRKQDISEFEAAQQLERFRRDSSEYRGPSMPLMSASGANGALPHHVPSPQGSRLLNDHPIFWMDSGGHYPGGSTDNTITMAVGTPEAKHIFAHTLVLQGFIAVATARIPLGTCAIQVDAIARQALWREGMDFEHSLGHGVGNYLNIHEGPLLGRDPSPISSVPLEIGMLVTNEPAFYSEGDFGLRIESHMISVASRHPGFMEFETISRLPIDPRLVDFGRLTPSERTWLADYHDAVLSDLEPILDSPSRDWLRALVMNFR